MRFLTFVLSGALQSWGDDARWDDRGTSAMPSKSAVIGMLGCCLGYPRGDERLPGLSGALSMAVRADVSGRMLWDFQTVQRPGGKILNSQGKPRSETIITSKQYLQDSCFRIFLWGKQETLDMCEYALKHPHWVSFLGRKSCPPSVPVVPSVVEFDTVDEALKLCFSDEENNHGEYMLCEIEASADMPGFRTVYRMDEVVCGDRNEYRERKVYTKTVQRGDCLCT